MTINVPGIMGNTEIRLTRSYPTNRCPNLGSFLPEVAKQAQLSTTALLSLLAILANQKNGQSSDRHRHVIHPQPFTHLAQRVAVRPQAEDRPAVMPERRKSSAALWLFSEPEFIFIHSRSCRLNPSPWPAYSARLRFD